MQVLSIGALTSGYHRDYQLTKGPVLAAVETALDMLDIVRLLPESLTVDKARCRAAVSEDTLATHRALALVKQGVPFREAYRKVAGEAREPAAVPKTAADVELPSYKGAPGDPGFAELAVEQHEASQWSLQERDRLCEAWRVLMKLSF